MRCLDNQESGFTIIEVLIAVMVLSVGLAAAAAMQTNAVTQSNEASRRSARSAVAEEWMEDLCSRLITPEEGRNVADLFSDNCTAGKECSDGNWYAAPVAAGSGAYRVTYRVVTDMPMDNLATVQVRVDPAGLSTAEQAAGTGRIELSYIRSMRYN